LNVWIANIDESGTHIGASHTAVSSVLGSARTWQDLAPLWQDVLNKYAIAYFHATEFNCGTGQCASLSQQERIACVKELISIASNCDLEYVAYVIEEKVFGSATRMYTNLNLSVYDYLLSTCICDLEIRGELEDSVAMYVFIEDGCPLSKNLSKLLMKAASMRPRRSFKVIGHISHENKKKYVPLQVADIIAYESFKYFQNSSQEPSRPIRLSFEKIIKGNPLRPYLIGEDWLNLDLEKVSQFLEGIGSRS